MIKEKGRVKIEHSQSSQQCMGNAPYCSHSIGSILQGSVYRLYGISHRFLRGFEDDPQ